MTAAAPAPALEPILDSPILIVDDSEFNRLLLRQIFERNGFCSVLCAHDGREALEKIQSFRPQLIVLDLMMPQMDGYEFCEKLRGHPEFASVPVLVQTAVVSQEDRNKIFRLGASDLVSKPVNPEELMARARVHLERLHLISDLQRYNARVAAELAQAREMQNELMPAAGLLNYCRGTYGIDIAHYFETPSEMGGDMWGVRPLGASALAIFMSDFSGHGVTASLNAFRLHTLMQELAPEDGQNPGAYLNLLNMRLARLLGKAQFATMFYGIIDTRHFLLHYAAAATPHPLMYRHKEGTIGKLDGTGLPLTVQLPSDYPSRSTPFNDGDALILYSDAFTETPWRGGHFLSEDTMMAYLEDALRSGMAAGAAVLRDTLVNYFRADAQLPVKDDLTLSIYHRLPG